MHREILDAVASERAEVEALNLRFEGAAGAEERLAIRKEIEAVKKRGMIEVFGIQLRYARAEGRVEVASRMEASSIEAIRNPKGEVPEEGR